MSFEDLKRDMISSKYFSDINDPNLLEKQRAVINSLVEKQFLSHLPIILQMYGESVRDESIDMLQRRYGLGGYKESTFLEMTSVLAVDLDQLSDCLVQVRNLCIVYYTRYYRLHKTSMLNANNHISFMCPGCNEVHSIRCNTDVGVVWSWNGSYESPTFNPSILVKGSKLTDKGSKDLEEWMKNGFPKQNERFDSVETICHSFVTDGKIQFLDDCTHNLKGQTVELPNWDLEE